jgi:hypothetical protein
MSKVTQNGALNSTNSERNVGEGIEVLKYRKEDVKIKAAVSQFICPNRGPLRSTRRLLRLVGWPLPNSFAGVPFYDVSFRAFTASSTIEKGTPTVQ